MREQRFEKNGDIVTRKIAGELFLVPIRGKLADMQRIFTLNTVAEHIWEELDPQKNLQDICSRVVESFEVEKERAEQDVREFITDLLEADLVKAVT